MRSCHRCGEPFFSKNNRQMFCAQHQGYDPVGAKLFRCEKCGKVVAVSPTDRRKVCLCPECIKEEEFAG